MKRSIDTRCSVCRERGLWVVGGAAVCLHCDNAKDFPSVRKEGK